ncbi:MAG: NAD-dependent epimerase/dehydratase family protein [Azonexus sp.]|jgi:UDP-glucuronate decarboxylase|nr:NAD-dependent epimerase/dehydratase family protein [Azonexus sp.]
MIRWITEQLGTAPANEVVGQTGLNLVDVRDLVDKGGNSVQAIRAKIDEGVKLLSAGLRTIVCCDYGISRSNAVAAGILARHDRIPFLDAVRMVQQRTGETEIKLEPLEAVRRALEGDARPTSNSSPTVLMTGGGGFIGTALRAHLADTTHVIAPSSNDVDIIKGATRLDMFAAECGAETMVHLANPRVYTSNVALGQTLSMLRNVLEVAASRRMRLIYLSGWEVFSGYAGELLVDENVPVLSKGPYGDAKLLAEELIQNFARTTNLNYTIVRSSPVYGAGSDRPKFIYNFAAKAKSGSKIVTHRYLNGDAALDLLHVDDLVNALARILNFPVNGLFHLGTGELTSTFEIAEFLVRTLQSKSEVTQANIESHVARIAMNISKSCAMLDWQPKINIWDGLTALIKNNSIGEHHEHG